MSDEAMEVLRSMPPVAGRQSAAWHVWCGERSRVLAPVAAVRADQQGQDAGSFAAMVEAKAQARVAHATKRMTEREDVDYWRGCLVTACSFLGLSAAADDPEAVPRPAHMFRPDPDDYAVCAICGRTVMVWCDGYASDFDAAAAPSGADQQEPDAP